MPGIENEKWNRVIMIDQIIELMTPTEILDCREFDEATPILPDRFPTFKDLLMARTSIRNLSILPLKTDEMRAYYKTLDKNLLAQDILNSFSSCQIFMCENEFPYFLPPDTVQYIIWINNPSMSHRDIARFIAMMVQEKGFSLDELILFERPRGIQTKLVRGTFPEIRHIHLWACK